LQLGFARLLLQMGCKVNPQNGDGSTPLMLALANRHDDIVKVTRRWWSGCVCVWLSVGATAGV
jgi:hypothetical protein